MATINVATIDGNSSLLVQRAEDLGSGTADNAAGKVIAIHRHDAIAYAAWVKVQGYGLTKNYLSSTVSASGDTTLVAAPGASSFISIPWFRLANESATETTVLLKSGASTQRFRAVLAPKGSAGFSVEMAFPVNMPLEIATNEALVINLGGANAIGYSFSYFVKAV
jgi:hypothetical protein